MKLNPDCIRDILLYIESHQRVYFDSANHCYSYSFITERYLDRDLPYDICEIIHSLLLMKDCGYIEIDIKESLYEIRQVSVRRITYSGYDFLESIRPQSVWEDTKQTLSAVGSFSLELILDVAKNLLSGLVSSVVQGTLP